jgi:hypothetical protein
MEPDPAYQQDGISWYSGCSELSDILRWFSPKELLHMKKEGYYLFRFDTEYVKDYSGHQIFSKAHLRSQEEIDLKTLI